MIDNIPLILACASCGIFFLATEIAIARRRQSRPNGRSPQASA